jgi:hypothetical protein
MNVIRQLIERWGKANAADDDPPFLEQDRPGTGRWRVWLHTQQNIARGDLSTAWQWFHSHALEDPTPRNSPVWTAEWLAVESDLLLRSGELRSALQAAHASLQQRYLLTAPDTALHTVDAIVNDIIELYAELNEGDVSSGRVFIVTLWLEYFLQSTTDFASTAMAIAANARYGAVLDELAKDALAWVDSINIQTLLRLTTGLESERQVDLNDTAPVLMVGEFVEIVRNRLFVTLADAKDIVGDSASALRFFRKALDAETQRRPNANEEEILRLRYNCANQLAKLGQSLEAAEEYKTLRTAFERLGYKEGELGCRHSLLRMEIDDGSPNTLVEEVGDLIREYEELWSSSSTHERRDRTKLLVDQAYRLFLSACVRSQDRSEGTILRLLRVLECLRLPREVTGAFSEAFAQHAAYELSPMSTIEVMLSRLKRFGSYTVLMAESGASSLVLVTVEGGNQSLVDRVHVEESSDELLTSLTELLVAVRSAADQLAERAITAQVTSPTQIDTIAVEAWRLMPPSIKASIENSEIIYYVPSNYGSIDEIPFEILGMDNGGLGGMKIISRMPSLQHLSQSLAPNRYDQRTGRSGVLVRAEDPFAIDDAAAVDEAVQLFQRLSVGSLSELKLYEEPTAEELVNALTSEVGFMHFIGHGVADDGGEALIFGSDQYLPVFQLVGDGSQRAPISVFSSCEVGRGRHVPGGAQRGLAARLLDAGSPAIVASTYRIPTRLLGQVAGQLYIYCRDSALGEAMRKTRQRLAARGLHPGAWATTVLFGDPMVWVGGTGEIDVATRRAGVGELLTRCWATGHEDDVETAVTTFGDIEQLSETDLAWIRSLVTQKSPANQDGYAGSERVRTIVAEVDAVAGLVLTMLELVGRYEDADKANWSNILASTLVNALHIADALDDEYARLCVIVRLASVLPVENKDDVTYLLDRAESALKRLADSGKDLNSIRIRLGDIRAQWEKIHVVNMGDRFGYDSETFAAADEGDLQATKQILSRMMEAASSPEALTGLLPWFFWTLRWIAANTYQAAADALVAVQADQRVGRLDSTKAEAITACLEGFRGPGTIPESVLDRATSLFDDADVNRIALEVFSVWDLIASGETIAVETLRKAVENALIVEGECGPTGASGYFRLLYAQRATELGALETARAEAIAALGDLSSVAAGDNEMITRLSQTAMIASQIMGYAGDENAASEVLSAYAKVIDEANSPQRRARDQHGMLGRYAADFLPLQD